MINFQELEKDMKDLENINYYNKPPYGIYAVTIIDIQRKHDTERKRDQIIIFYKIMGGDYKNFGIRDSFFLSENATKSTQLFQYSNIKSFFQTIAPEIKWIFENMDQLESAFVMYKHAINNTIYQIIYKQDRKGYDRVYFQNNFLNFKDDSLENKDTKSFEMNDP